MKRIFFILLLVLLNSCEDFEDLNVDPNVVTDPPAEAVFTYALKKLGDYKGSEWYFDNHQFLQWLQYLVGDDGNANDINTLEPRGDKYHVFYTETLPNLVEVRRIIDEKDETGQQFYRRLRAATYVVQVYHALRVTDIFGAIPYTEAGQGRHQGKLDPKYDTQAELFQVFLNQLDQAISELSVPQDPEVDLTNADFIYQGDWTKWIKCANAIKLRIAVRLESQEQAKTREIIGEVLTDDRLFESIEEEFIYHISKNWQGTSGAILDWKGRLWASKTMVDFMKSTVDPRLRVFFEPNGFHQATLDAFETTGTPLPPLIDLDNDNQVLYTAEDGEPMYGYRYIGGAVSRLDPNQADYLYIENPNAVGLEATQLSKYHQRLLMNTMKDYGDGAGTGTYVDVLISYAEVAFMMAEFILKGYADGDAANWYAQGISASIRSYNRVAERGKLDLRIAQKSYTYVSITKDEITNYLQQEQVVLDGTNDLEKVYIQQHLNFYRAPDEGFVLARRTGYPKFNSTLLPREYVDNPDLKFPRRMPTPDPGDLNRENWVQSNSDQGFSNLDESPEILNAQRMWWDLNHPEFGEGD